VNTYPSKSLIAVIVFSLAATIFAAVSTYDFVAHLDRQVHSITCSYLPGVGEKDDKGESGCYAVMMSPYSSVFRTKTWGGLPVALPGMAVYAFIFFLSVYYFTRRKELSKADSLFLFLATCLPFVSAIVMFYISLNEVKALCKLCMGMYICSAGMFAAGLIAFLHKPDPANDRPINVTLGRWAMLFVEGLVFVGLPVAIYMSAKPAYTADMGKCGELVHADDKYGVKIKTPQLGSGPVPAIEVLDPLCPACKTLKERMAASEIAKQLNLEMVMFPLDKECNWMIGKSLHPGACAVTEAILCAGNAQTDVLLWAFDNQQAIMETGAKDVNGVYAMIKAKFPAVSECVNKPEVKSKVNQSLRWVSSNSLPILTPQLYVKGRRVCDEDTDLGLDFALNRLIEGVPEEPAQAQQPPAGGATGGGNVKDPKTAK